MGDGLDKAAVEQTENRRRKGWLRAQPVRAVTHNQRPDCRRGGAGPCDTQWLLELSRRRAPSYRGDRPYTDCDQASESRDPAYGAVSVAGHVEIVDAFRLQWSAEAEAQYGGAGFEIGFIVVLEVNSRRRQYQRTRHRNFVAIGED